MKLEVMGDKPGKDARIYFTSCHNKKLGLFDIWNRVYIGHESELIFLKESSRNIHEWTHIYHCNSLDEISIQSELNEREYVVGHVVGKHTEAAHRIERNLGETSDSKNWNRHLKSLGHTQHSQGTFTYYLLIYLGGTISSPLDIIIVLKNMPNLLFLEFSNLDIVPLLPL